MGTISRILALLCLFSVAAWAQNPSIKQFTNTQFQAVPGMPIKVQGFGSTTQGVVNVEAETMAFHGTNEGSIAFAGASLVPGMFGTTNPVNGVLNIRAFGVRGDGTDETTAIQTALNAAEGKTLFMPVGTYKYTDHVYMRPNTTLEGYGTFVQGAMLKWFIPTNGCKVRNLTFNGNADHLTTTNLFSEQVVYPLGQNMLFEGITVTNAMGECIATDNAQDVTYSGCFIADYADHGIYHSTLCSNIVINGCHFRSSTDTECVKFRNMAGKFAVANNIASPVATFCMIEVQNGTQCAGGVVSGNYAATKYRSVILIAHNVGYTGNAITITGNSFENWNLPTSYDAMDIVWAGYPGSVSLQVTGNAFHNYRSYCNTYNSQNGTLGGLVGVDISHNTFLIDDTVNLTGTQLGIGYCTNFTFGWNTIVDNSGPNFFAATLPYLININGPSSQARVIGNSVTRTNTASSFIGLNTTNVVDLLIQDNSANGNYWFIYNDTSTNHLEPALGSTIKIWNNNWKCLLGDVLEIGPSITNRANYIISPHLRTISDTTTLSSWDGASFNPAMVANSNKTINFPQINTNIAVFGDTGSSTSPREIYITAGNSGAAQAGVRFGGVNREFRLYSTGSPYKLQLDYVGTDSPKAGLFSWDASTGQGTLGFGLGTPLYIGDRGATAGARIVSLSAGTLSTQEAAYQFGTENRQFEFRATASPYGVNLNYVGTDAPLAQLMHWDALGAFSIGKLGQVTTLNGVVEIPSQVVSTLMQFDGVHGIVSIANSPGVLWNSGLGSFSYSTHPEFYNDGTTLSLSPAVGNNASLLTFNDHVAGSARGSIGFSSNGDTNLTINVNNGNLDLRPYSSALVRVRGGLTLQNASVLPNTIALFDASTNLISGAAPYTFKVSSTDTTPSYLTNKLVAGSNITLTHNNVGGVETLTIASTGGGGAGSGDLTFDSPLTVTVNPGVSTNVSIIANGISDSLIRQSAGVSVVGRSANSAGNVADITASANGQFLARSGNALAFVAPAITNYDVIAGANVTVTPGGSGTNKTFTVAASGTFSLAADLAEFTADDTNYLLTGGYADVDFANTPPGQQCEITLPSAGTYIITAAVGTLVNEASGSGWNLFVKLVNNTDSTDLAGSERRLGNGDAGALATYAINQPPITIKAKVTVGASKVIRLQASLSSTGGFTTGSVIKDYTTLDYIKL